MFVDLISLNIQFSAIFFLIKVKVEMIAIFGKPGT